MSQGSNSIRVWGQGNMRYRMAYSNFHKILNVNEKFNMNDPVTASVLGAPPGSQHPSLYTTDGL